MKIFNIVLYGLVIQTHHSLRAATASFLTSLFLSSSGLARARSTLARKGNTCNSTIQAVKVAPKVGARSISNALRNHLDSVVCVACTRFTVNLTFTVWLGRPERTWTQRRAVFLTFCPERGFDSIIIRQSDSNNPSILNVITEMCVWTVYHSRAGG